MELYMYLCIKGTDPPACHWGAYEPVSWTSLQGARCGWRHPGPSWWVIFAPRHHVYLVVTEMSAKIESTYVSYIWVLDIFHAHCVAADPGMWEIRGKTNCPECATCNREIECSQFQRPKKCNFVVDKGIGAIWPNSSVRSQMKLFEGKINPPSPPLPSLPPSCPCIC